MIEPTEAMIGAAVEHVCATEPGNVLRDLICALRAALNHPDAPTLFWPAVAVMPAGPTVSVRIGIVTSSDGTWDFEHNLSRRQLEGRQVYYLTATLPLPQPVDIAAGVEGVGDE